MVPTSNNDSGTFVGCYTDSKSQGFPYLNGEWVTLDYPKATGTSLTRISNSATNSGTIVGNAHFSGTQISPVTGQPIATAFCTRTRHLSSLQ